MKESKKDQTLSYFKFILSVFETHMEFLSNRHPTNINKALLKNFWMIAQKKGYIQASGQQENKVRHISWFCNKDRKHHI